MKHFSRWPLLLILYFNFSFAAEPQKTVDIDFRQVGIPELSNAILSGMLKRDYLLSSDVLTDERKITMSLKAVSQEKILQVFTRLMASQGVSVTESDNVILLEKTKQINDNIIEFPSQPSSLDGDKSLLSDKPILKPAIYRYYQPVHRSITYLAKIAKFTGVQVAEIDDTSNKLVYSADTDELLDKTENMLKVVDSPSSAITIKAALIEYTDSNNSSRSLSGAMSLLAGKLGVVYSAGQLLSNSIIFKNKTLNMAISAIDGDSSFKYLAEPTIRVLNGEKARLIVGSEVPIRGNVTLDKNGNPIQSVEYRTAGVQFDVLPKINGDSISLYINQQISNFGLTTTSNIDSPTLFKRQAETTLDIKRGSLVMMAGLDETKNIESSSGLAFLPKFLRSKAKDETKSQILLLLEVVDEPI